LKRVGNWNFSKRILIPNWRTKYVAKKGKIAVKKWIFGG